MILLFAYLISRSHRKKNHLKTNSYTSGIPRYDNAVTGFNEDKNVGNKDSSIYLAKQNNAVKIKNEAQNKNFQKRVQSDNERIRKEQERLRQEQQRQLQERLRQEQQHHKDILKRQQQEQQRLQQQQMQQQQERQRAQEQLNRMRKWK